MTNTRIRTLLTAESLSKPELKDFLGKEVDIQLIEPAGDPFDDLIDHEYHAACESEVAGYDRIPTIEEVRHALRGIPGSMTQDYIDEREERF